MNDLKDILKFLVGFTPWLLFLFFSGHTLLSLEISIVVCFAASLLFGFRELRKGFILQWGTLYFFAGCIVTINFMKIMFVVKNMGVLSNGFLALLIWVTILMGKPFTLQYARIELPKEQWDNPGLVNSCRFIAVVWALILTLSASISLFKVLNPNACPDWVYFDVSIGIILGGSTFTTLYKKYKRARR